MKNLTAKYLSLMMLATMLTGTVQANRDEYSNGGDCCPRQYECGCNPLYCGAWDLQVQGGVAPILWRNRGPISGVNCTSSATVPVIQLFPTSPKFSKFFKTPWIIGGQVGYAMSDNTRVFAEFDYSQAKAKSAVVLTSTSSVPGTISFAFNKYKIFEGYVGARYYWDRWCDHLSFFLGGKVGFLRHKKQNVDLIFAFPATVVAYTLSDQAFYAKSTRISGGGHIGLDYCICGNWSIVLTGEVVATCGPRGAAPLSLGTSSSLNGFTNLFIPAIGTELRFPVTLAVRYSF
jgi:opacity protein-like surface antigen